MREEFATGEGSPKTRESNANIRQANFVPDMAGRQKTKSCDEGALRCLMHYEFCTENVVQPLTEVRWQRLQESVKEWLSFGEENLDCFVPIVARSCEKELALDFVSRITSLPFSHFLLQKVHR